MTEELRLLADGPEQDAAYAVIVERTDWLRSIGSTQWLRPLPLEIFNARQDRRENFGYFRHGVPAGAAALARGYRPHYLEKGKGLGRRILELSEKTVLEAGVGLICLDCNAASPLPAFYEAAGYGERGRFEMESQGRVLRVALYEKRLAKPEKIG